MRYIFILMFAICSAVASSQARIGCTIREVKKDYPEIQPLNDSTYTWTTGNADVYYVCSDGIVTETVIFPHNTRDEKIYLSFYDKKFQKDGTSKWIFKQSNDSCYIYKITRPGGGVYFVWSFNPQAYGKSYDKR